MTEQPLEALRELLEKCMKGGETAFTHTTTDWSFGDDFWRRTYAGLAMTKLNVADYNTLAEMCSDAFVEANAMLAEAKKREEEKPDGPSEPK